MGDLKPLLSQPEPRPRRAVGSAQERGPQGTLSDSRPPW